MVTIIKGRFKDKVLKIRIMASYLALIALCLIFVNMLAAREIENYYVNMRKSEIYSYAKALTDEASVKGAFESLAFKKKAENLAYESFSRIHLIKKSDYLQKKMGTNYKIENYQYETYGLTFAFEGQDYIEKTKIKDEHILFVALPVKVDNNIIGAILISNSLADIYSNTAEIKRQLKIISLVTLMVFITASYIISGRITKPVERVIGAIEAMAEGNLKQRVETKGNDELARLCYAFNDMNKKINQQDSERRQFVADASHELKSPLASIKVLVQSLISGGVENKEIAYDFLTDIDSEVDRLTNIVGRLLELTRLESGYGMKVEKFDIGKMIQEVINKVTPIAQGKNLKIKSKLLGIYIEGNRDNIFRAIYNIIENAVKYSDDNGAVDIWLEEGNDVKIYVKDNGTGIPEEEIYKIFDRFYRVDKARNRKTGGSGLGLSIAKEIIKRHNGNIQVKSRVGEGSLFIIAIPYKLQIKEC